MQIDLIPSIVALLVAAGGGAGVSKLLEGIGKIRSGMSAKESARKVDIVTQRDKALASEQKAWDQVDDEAEKRRLVQKWAARLERQLILAGIEPTPEPVLEKTITKAQLKELREKE